MLYVRKVLLKLARTSDSLTAVVGLIRRQRHGYCAMDCELLRPPSQVRGMTQLDRLQFKKAIQVPRLWAAEAKAQAIRSLVKKLILKMDKLKPMNPAEFNGQPGSEILLHPVAIEKWEDLPYEELQKHDVLPEHFGHVQLELTYDNWRADEILKAVLPADKEGMASYSLIGHIVHLNLRDHLLPYRQLIGAVLLDKVPKCKTVVNKETAIDNTYRNFQFELLGGEASYQVQVKENGLAFEFDFSKVYWNPRLSTEHERIVQMLKTGDVLYDVFAGVGPFAVPAAKKKCHVLANDLNPESYKWLQHNMKRNKCLEVAQMFSKDGNEFIREDLKRDLLERWRTPSVYPDYKIHVTMNLPAMAVEFLPSFRGLFFKEAEAKLIDFSSENIRYPLVHVYTFAKGDDTKALALQMASDNLKMPIAENLLNIHFVRNVSPKKDMYRISFYLTKEILTSAPLAATTRGLKRKLSEDQDLATRMPCPLR